jgi:hypothetical protein
LTYKSASRILNPIKSEFLSNEIGMDGRYINNQDLARQLVVEATPTIKEISFLRGLTDMIETLIGMVNLIFRRLLS